MWSKYISDDDLIVEMRRIVSEGGAMYDLMEYVFASTKMPPEHQKQLSKINLIKCFRDAFHLSLKQAILVVTIERFWDSSRGEEDKINSGIINDQMLGEEIMPYILAKKESWQSDPKEEVAIHTCD